MRPPVTTGPDRISSAVPARGAGPSLRFFPGHDALGRIRVHFHSLLILP